VEEGWGPPRWPVRISCRVGKEQRPGKKSQRKQPEVIKKSQGPGDHQNSRMAIICTWGGRRQFASAKSDPRKILFFQMGTVVSTYQSPKRQASNAAP